jgi:RIO-like serine/threonine protein kinase
VRILPYPLHFNADRLFQAHKQAYWRCGILHRDISANNILLTTGLDFQGGLLIDWDLCKQVDDPEKSTGGARQITRTVCCFGSSTWHIF